MLSPLYMCLKNLAKDILILKDEYRISNKEGRIMKFLLQHSLFLVRHSAVQKEL